MQTQNPTKQHLKGMILEKYLQLSCFSKNLLHITKNRKISISVQKFLLAFQIFFFYLYI